MEQQSFISIALCTFNGEKYLAEQIESILTQTYTNFELVIVDDGSTDETNAISKAYADKDARIKHFVNAHNLGFNKNFEKALSLTTGSFIAISDQDDIWEPNKLEVLLNTIGDNWLVCSNSAYVTESGEPTGRTLMGELNFGGRDFRSMLIMNFVTGHTCMLSRDFLPYILPFPQKGYYDWWMGFIAIYHKKLAYANRVLTKYRMHATSVTNVDLRKDELAFKTIDLNNALMMMGNFLTYIGLNNKDKHLISKLKKAYALKLHQSYNITLIRLLSKHYHVIFPELKTRKLLSRLKFAFRYSKKLQ